jgi:membrane protein DedA with SNARE-associated domain
MDAAKLEPNAEQEARQPWPKREIYLGIAALVLTVGLCVVGYYYRGDLMRMVYVANYSLIALFLIAFLGSGLPSITAVPLPFWLLVLAMPGLFAYQWGILAPVWIGLVTALGIALGQLLTFMVAYGGRSLSERLSRKLSSRWYDKAIGFAQRHGSWAVFVMSAMFNPIHLPMTVAIAALHYPPHKFFLFSFLGALLKSFVVAFAGYFGLGSIFGFLEA